MFLYGANSLQTRNLYWYEKIYVLCVPSVMSSIIYVWTQIPESHAQGASGATYVVL